jgi:hypothetical protein
MSMFNITGQVVNTFEAPARVDKDTGKVETEAKSKVQLLGDMPVPGGQSRMELVTLTCEDQAEFEALRGRTISVPLGIFAPAKGQVIYFIPKGSKPVEVTPIPVPVSSASSSSTGKSVFDSVPVDSAGSVADRFRVKA